MKTRLIHLLLLFWLPVSASWAQDASQPAPQAQSPTSPTALPDSPTAKSSAHDRPPRIFWVIPTFTITESKQPAKLSPKQKLEIVVKDTIDPYTIGFTAVTAGIAQANNDMKGYGQGASGYAKRFAASYTDQASAGFFGGFLIPSVLHQDPRYYRQGSGPFASRFTHALIRPLVTHTDSGRRDFNWSGLLGSLAASALSNTYYPQEERGVGKTFSRWGMGIPLSVIDHLIDEFGPDLQHMVTPQRKPTECGSPASASEVSIHPPN